ncbi:MAG: hypothetical protein Q9198_000974 [Flavoplaca austrocitrina]
MIIQLPNGLIRQRLACLDTVSDVDVISPHVVDSLDLETEKYTGHAIRPLGPDTYIYMPERKVTLDWNVAEFHKTYTTTFAVLDKEHGDDYDVLLGRDTIRKIGFHMKNRKIWWTSAGRQVPISDILTTDESRGKVDIDLDQWQQSHDAGADKATTPTGSSFGVTDSEISTNQVNIPQGFRNTCEINVSHLGRLIDTPLTAVLDTVSEINLIDSTIVEELGLTKSKCQRNTKNFNSEFFTATGWEVLIDWHVAGFDKQHNGTFLVVNVKASGCEYDVILGQDTIREVGFFPDAEEAPSEAPSLTTASTLSTASVEGFLEAAEDVAELLFQDPVLNPLYHKSLGVFKINEFERKFAKLLRGFASQLRTESVNDIHQKAVRFLKTRTNLIVSHIGHRLDPKKTELAQRFRQLASQKPKKIMQSTAIERNGIVELELPSSSGSSEPEEPENAYLYHREQVRSFILQSNALSNLRENFGRLVLQSHFEVKNSADATPNTTATVEERITPTLDPQSNDDEDKSSELIYAPSKWLIGNNLRNPFSANTGRCIQLMFRIAEFLELREMPLRPGCNRIRWTCVSRIRYSQLLEAMDCFAKFVFNIPDILPSAVCTE